MRIEEASNLLRIPAQSLRLWLRSGHCPFGGAWQNITTKTTKITWKGQIYFINKFLNNEGTDNEND